MIFVGILILVLFFGAAIASLGDRSQFYTLCLDSCSEERCFPGQKVISELMFPVSYLWPCEDECKYACMWRTVTYFEKIGRHVPQFHGKWPFVRFLGIQEPASTIFSILNFLANVKMLSVFRKHTTSASPMYVMWHIFGFVHMNAWIWSTLFHTKDTDFTELMDYTSATSVIFVTCACMLFRVLHSQNDIIKYGVIGAVLIFFISHFVHIATVELDYGYNMKVNIAIGVVTFFGWLLWCIMHRKLAYTWKIAVFITGVGLASLLEMCDFAPFLWTFDAHSLWHLSTAPLTYFAYSFAIDDVKFLYKGLK